MEERMQEIKASLYADELIAKELIAKELKNLKDKLAWYDLFVDYIYEIDSNKYNQACEYANKTKEL